MLRIATELADDGTIRVLAPLFEAELGELDGSRSARADQLAAAFRDAGADVAVRADIIRAMWAKWVFIASIGAVTSLMGAPRWETSSPFPGVTTSLVRYWLRRRGRPRRRGTRCLTPSWPRPSGS